MLPYCRGMFDYSSERHIYPKMSEDKAIDNNITLFERDIAWRRPLFTYASLTSKICFTEPSLFRHAGHLVSIKVAQLRMHLNKKTGPCRHSQQEQHGVKLPVREALEAKDVLQLIQ